jgi:hypothetical protein
MHLAVNIGGIPYLAKNERDMGHPALVRERQFSRRPFTPEENAWSSLGPEKHRPRPHSQQ